MVRRIVSVLPVLLLSAVLAACGGGGGEAPSGADGSQAGADGGSGVVALTGAEAVSRALPTEAAVPEGWEPGDTDRRSGAVSGAEAVTGCRDLGADCTGLAAAGVARYRMSEQRTRTAAFTILAFDTVGNAEAMVAGYVADRRADQTDHEVGQSLAVETGADTTEAFSARGETVVIMRVGTVVASVEAYLPKGADPAAFARLLVERVRKVAAGGNPDTA